jgi:glycine/serine hydroxymethyltransferase
MGSDEMTEIGRLIVEGIAARGNEAAQASVRARAVALAERFPVPGLMWTRA